MHTTTIEVSPQYAPTCSAFPHMVVGLVEQLRRMITADESPIEATTDKQSRCAQLLKSSQLVSEEQICEAEKRSKASGLSLTDSLMSNGWISKDLLEAARTMQIQIETGEIGPAEAHAVLKGQKRLHDAHVRADFFNPRNDILQALPSETESFIDERFGHAVQPCTVAQPQRTPTEKAGYARRMWY